MNNTEGFSPRKFINCFKQFIKDLNLKNMSPDLKRFAEINGAYGWMKHEKVHPDVLRDAIQDGLRVETSHKGGQ